MTAASVIVGISKSKAMCFHLENENVRYNPCLQRQRWRQFSSVSYCLHWCESLATGSYLRLHHVGNHAQPLVCTFILKGSISGSDRDSHARMKDLEGRKGFQMLTRGLQWSVVHILKYIITAEVYRCYVVYRLHLFTASVFLRCRGLNPTWMIHSSKFSKRPLD